MKPSFEFTLDRLSAGSTLLAPSADVLGPMEQETRRQDETPDVLEISLLHAPSALQPFDGVIQLNEASSAAVALSGTP